MYDFEVRVLNIDAQPTLILPGPHLSVFAALQTARKLAADGHLVEVWRNTECVHRECFTGSAEVLP